MAREIKYFTGNAAGTVYTVPAGRTAKVIVNYIDTQSDFGSTFLIGGRLAFPTGLQYGVGFVPDLSSTSALSPGVNQGIANSASQPYVVNTIWYLGAGSNVGSSGGIVPYSFMAIEEF